MTGIINHILILTLVTMALSACAAGDPELLQQRLAGLQRQAAFYQEEAEAWRQAGNAGMGRYLDIRARAMREQAAEADDDWFDALIEILLR